MNRISSGRSRPVNDLRDVEIALQGRARSDGNRAIGQLDVQRLLIGVGKDRNRLDAELAARLDDANGNLAAVRDQQTSNHERLQPGFRFSRNARSPSCPSIDTLRSASAAAVSGIERSKGSSHT